MLVQYFYFRYGWRDYWVMFFIKEALGFTYGPLLFLYVSVATDRIPRFRARDMLHFIPVLAYLLIEVNTIHPLFIDFANFNDDRNDLGISMHAMIIYLLKFISILAYLIAAVVLIRSYRIKIRDYFSDVRRIGLNWLQVLITIMASAWIVGAFAALSIAFTPEYIDYIIPFPFIVISILIYLLGYYAVIKPDLYAVIHAMNENSNSAGQCVQKKKYAKSELPDQIRDDHLRRIRSCLKNDKAYLDSELTLRRLSDLTGISTHSISQVLNESENTNFYSLINRYRAEYAKNLLGSPDWANATVIEICFRSGFNSKSSFNLIFKKYFGMTPSDFRKMKSA
jgi:AraC-like DNA-binding protein